MSTRVTLEVAQFTGTFKAFASIRAGAVFIGTRFNPGDWARILVLVGSAKPAADHLGPVKPAALGGGMEYRRHQACPPTEPTAAPSRWCLAHRFGLHLADRKVRQSHSIPLARQ
jgi:hypothetical protein